MKFGSKDSSQSISSELRKNFTKLSEINSDELLRKAVSALTTGQDYTVKLPKDRKEFMLLCCLSWYYPETVGILLRLELDKRKNIFGPEYEQKISLLLTSEPEMIIYIMESDVLGKNPNEVFGNILAKKVKVDIKPLYPKKPKRLIRHRGYRDKGSLRLGSEYLAEEKKDFSLTERQNEIEYQRQAAIDSFQFWRGFLE